MMEKTSRETPTSLDTSLIPLELWDMVFRELVSEDLEKFDYQAASGKLLSIAETSKNLHGLVGASFTLRQVVKGLAETLIEKSGYVSLKNMRNLLPWIHMLDEKAQTNALGPFRYCEVDSGDIKALFKRYGQLAPKNQRIQITYAATALPEEWACEFVVRWRRGNWEKSKGENLINRMISIEPAEAKSIESALTSTAERIAAEERAWKSKSRAEIVARVPDSGRSRI